MTKQCNHQDLSFLGILSYTEYPQKCFICESCRTFVTDYITTEEMNQYNETKGMNLQLPV